jgi:hypothetical protein
MEEVIESLKQRAREMGGDAVIGLAELNETRGGMILGDDAIILDRDPVLSGTVIRYIDPGCTE